MEIAKVADVLDSIGQDPGCERYRELLCMRCVEKLGKKDIAEVFGYSHKQSVYGYIRYKVIQKFAVSICTRIR